MSTLFPLGGLPAHPKKNPFLKDQFVSLSPATLLRPVRLGRPYHEHKFPAGIARKVIEARKPTPSDPRQGGNDRNRRRETQIHTKLDQPSWKDGQHQTPETRPQLQTSRKKRSWTPQETMATCRCRNRSKDLINGGIWRWLFTKSHFKSPITTRFEETFSNVFFLWFCNFISPSMV